MGNTSDKLQKIRSEYGDKALEEDALNSDPVKQFELWLGEAMKIAGRLQHESFRKRTLGSLYLDQSFIAGIGNYLRSEILFQAKLAPTARPMDLTRRNLQRLARATLAVSQRSYRTHGLTVTPTTRKKITELDSDFAKTRFAVFAREHRPCVNCSTPIERDQFTARRLYWCPVCQPG